MKNEDEVYRRLYLFSRPMYCTYPRAFCPLVNVACNYPMNNLIWTAISRASVGEARWQQARGRGTACIHPHTIPERASSPLSPSSCEHAGGGPSHLHPEIPTAMPRFFLRIARRSRHHNARGTVVGRHHPGQADALHLPFCRCASSSSSGVTRIQGR
jgi:hypothetical protein